MHCAKATMPTSKYFRAMGTKTMGNVDKSPVKMRCTYFFSILNLVVFLI